MTEPEATTHRFEAEVSQVLGLVINSLYSNKEIFLRELVSNAADALDKLRFRALTEPELVEGGADLRVRLEVDAEAGTLTIADNGVGMTSEELVRNLGTVAHSGTQEFLRSLAERKEGGDVSLIGQFGVGFYSAYLVADRVEVVSRAAGTKQAHRWISDGKDSFTIEPARRVEQGTDVILHLVDEQREYLNEARLRGLVARYSDYIGHPVELRVDKPVGEGDSATTAVTYERLNAASALWQRDPKSVDEAQYAEFYKHLSHDWEGPLAHRHVRVEGTQQFTTMLFIPERPPFDLFTPDSTHGVRLYVKRVFIMDDCEELLPRWLRFVRGVVDSEDLPLNVSREILQDSKLVRTIRKQIVKQCLDMLEELAEGDRYGDVWAMYGAVLKEGLHFETQRKDRLAKLLRFDSSHAEGLTSLDDYVSRMPEGQPAIYYALGPSRAAVAASPHVEGLRARGWEILYLTDAIDQWVAAGLAEHGGKRLVSAMDAELDLPAESVEAAEEKKTELGGLLDHVAEVLREHVSEVKISSRLTDSPVCLVLPPGGVTPYVEALMRLQHQDLPKQKRILEVNPGHELVRSLVAVHEQDADDPQLTEWIHVLHEQALLAEGSPIADPARFSARLTALLTEAARRRTAS